MTQLIWKYYPDTNPPFWKGEGKGVFYILQCEPDSSIWRTAFTDELNRLDMLSIGPHGLLEEALQACQRHYEETHDGR